ncbi:DUF4296 domain-containing protein [Tamlana fucoidanivorans]|uniref:DUF4296 domain-containing protein n=1 Tax=Allotamlana fucoidanivorans TaxID=2583814 RepID=A0A5C4SK50_9FLAO|nr:DUF4296 domain-containing protein [Tamlana fucoidanivorans]TNJ44235.1 DUF4296 domain-containing protein [Tamlana fucoidanivorans]
MIRRFSIGFVVGCVFLGCNEYKGPEKPEDLIPKDKMVNILIDAKLLTTANTKNKRIMRENNLDINSYVFKKHGIDSLQFAKSNSYYAYHMDLYEEIFKIIVDSLERLNIKLKDQEALEWKEQTKREEDSLRAIRIEKDIDTLLIGFKQLDSLTMLRKRDSIRKILIEKESEKQDTLLITPVSDSVALPEK